MIIPTNENFTNGSYNDFSKLIRNKDCYINAPKLVNVINNKEGTKKA
jgi:hypothetical protein